MPGERDERIHKSKTFTVTEPEPDEYELYDLTVDPYEERNLAHPTHADDRSRRLEAHMFELLVQQLAKKRLVPEAGEVPGYRPPGDSVPSPWTGSQVASRRWSVERERQAEPRQTAGANRVLHGHETVGRVVEAIAGSSRRGDARSQRR